MPYYLKPEYSEWTGKTYYRHVYYERKEYRAVLAQATRGFHSTGESETVHVQPGQRVWAVWAEGGEFVTVYPGDVRYIGGWARAADGQAHKKPTLVLTLAHAQEWLQSYPQTARKAPDRPTVYKGQLPQEVQ